MNIEVIADYQCVVGEGPLWHPMHKRLYWSDIDTGRMFWFDPATGRDEQCYDGPKVGGFTVQAISNTSGPVGFPSWSMSELQPIDGRSRYSSRLL